MPKIVLLGWLAVALTLCCNVDSARSESMTVVDALGRSVPISLPIRRIVALNSDALEVLRILKAKDRVVGVFSKIVREPGFWGELAALPKVGGWQNPDPETIAGLEPDLVLAYGRNPGQDMEQKLAMLEIPFLRLDFHKIESLEKEIRTLGHLLGRQAEATTFCDWHHQRLEIIRQKLSTVSERRLVFIESYGDYVAAGPGSGGNEMCVLAGGNNIAASLAIPFPHVTPEWVVSQNPQVIIKAAGHGNGYDAKDSTPFNRRRDAILARPAWHLIAAVTNRNVHVMDSAIWTGPRAFVGIAWMARWSYPGLFRDLDPEEWHKTYLQTFQDMAYRGVYVSDSLNNGVR